MQREVDWFKGKPLESRMTYYQASAALSLGAPPISRTFWKCRAIALRNGLKEQAVSITNEAFLEVQRSHSWAR
jgi:hypothetical protein